MSFAIERVTAGNLAMEYLPKDLATVIPAGNFVAEEAVTGLAINAVAASTALRFAPYGADATMDVVGVLVNNPELIGPGAINFAQTQNNLVCDLDISGGQQVVQQGASVTGVLKIVGDVYAGVVGSKDNIRVTINKMI